MTDPRRLSAETLRWLPPEVERPGYDRSQVRPGVVHLGVGAFHRAHQAVVFDDLIRDGDLRWGAVGASLRSADVHHQLSPQDGLYTVLGAGRPRVIGALRDVLVAPRDPRALVEALASCHLVTLTVTEKGYKLDPVTGGLLADDPDLAADLADLSAPRTAPGFLVSALALRRARGGPAFTAISCDNLPENGARLRAAVLALAAHHDRALADWIAEHAAFPQTMVDRIVPATTPQDIDTFGRQYGVRDLGLVKTEPFTQWVIEDRFAGPRPDFAAAGVQLTARVGPWEDAKLRMLNGAHSAMAYLGGLAGVEFIHQMVARPEVVRFVERLWDEAESTLSPPPGLDIAAYRTELMARFANPALQHRTRQIAMDGSQKLPQRLLATIAARLARDQSIEALALGVAGWMRWQGARDDAGQTFKVDDPLAEATARLVAEVQDSAGQVDALLSLSGIFPADLAADPRLRLSLTRHLERLSRQGALAALA
jgi:fructuronate reductase